MLKDLPSPPGGNTGWPCFFDPHNDEALSDCMMKVADHAAKPVAAELQNSVRYNWDKSAHGFAKIYRLYS